MIDKSLQSEAVTKHSTLQKIFLVFSNIRLLLKNACTQKILDRPTMATDVLPSTQDDVSKQKKNYLKITWLTI